MNHCPNCGAELQDSYKYCSNCGSPSEPEREKETIHVFNTRPSWQIILYLIITALMIVMIFPAFLVSESERERILESVPLLWYIVLAAIILQFLGVLLITLRFQKEKQLSGIGFGFYKSAKILMIAIFSAVTVFFVAGIIYIIVLHAKRVANPINRPGIDWSPFAGFIFFLLAIVAVLLLVQQIRILRTATTMRRFLKNGGRRLKISLYPAVIFFLTSTAVLLVVVPIECRGIQTERELAQFRGHSVSVFTETAPLIWWVLLCAACFISGEIWSWLKGFLQPKNRE